MDMIEKFTRLLDALGIDTSLKDPPVPAEESEKDKFQNMQDAWGEVHQDNPYTDPSYEIVKDERIIDEAEKTAAPFRAGEKAGKKGEMLTKKAGKAMNREVGDVISDAEDKMAKWNFDATASDEEKKEWEQKYAPIFDKDKDKKKKKGPMVSVTGVKMYQVR